MYKVHAVYTKQIHSADCKYTVFTQCRLYILRIYIVLTVNTQCVPSADCVH